MENIRRAFENLIGAGVKIRRASSLYKTEPVDFRLQPWFVNCVAEARTFLPPRALLKLLKTIEGRLGRCPSRVPKGPRRIDIDILLYENVVVRTPGLTIPHERLTERRFILVPLGELAPRLRHPVTRRTVRQMARDTADRSRVVKLRLGRRDSKIETPRSNPGRPT